jgi:predicted O-linked N-acetylglucosamine transferase (SPINDLY family)
MKYRFVEMEGMGHLRMAERIRADEIDVLVDLTGFTLSMITEANPAPDVPSPTSFLVP